MSLKGEFISEGFGRESESERLGVCVPRLRCESERLGVSLETPYLRSEGERLLVSFETPHLRERVRSSSSPIAIVNDFKVVEK